jgi:hypothetical protein
MLSYLIVYRHLVGVLPRCSIRAEPTSYRAWSQYSTSIIVIHISSFLSQIVYLNSELRSPVSVKFHSPCFVIAGLSPPSWSTYRARLLLIALRVNIMTAVAAKAQKKKPREMPYPRR